MGVRAIRSLAAKVSCVDILVMLGCLALTACSQQAGTASTELGANSIQTTNSTTVFPKLEPADKVRITVFNEPQLSGEYTVDSAGSIAYPLVGQVAVAGLDATGVERKLYEALSGRYLVKPKISVEIATMRPLYIMGEVNRPGEVPFRPGLNAMTAIAAAGGFGPRASTGSIMIQRANEREPKSYPVDPSIPIYPGDVIRVNERMF